MSDSSSPKKDGLEDGSSAVSEKIHRIPSADVDNALHFLQDGKSMEAAGVDDKRLVRKVDWRIVPIMFACYTMQFVDKVNINVRQDSNIAMPAVFLWLIYVVRRCHGLAAGPQAQGSAVLLGCHRLLLRLPRC